jgi:hypothetical protein
MNLHQHKYSRIRALLFFLLIAVVHAFATIALTDYYMQKAAEIVVDVFTNKVESGQTDENAFNAAIYKTQAETKFVTMALTFLYMPAGPFWQILRNVSFNKKYENPEPKLDKRKNRAKNVLWRCTIINSLSFSLCVWICYRLFLIIRFRNRQKVAQQSPGRDCQ